MSIARVSRPSRDGWFLGGLALLAGLYATLIVVLIAVGAMYTSPGDLVDALRSAEIRHAVKLSLITCSIATILSLWVAVPAGYLLTRTEFRGKAIIDAIFDIPIVLPPLVVGLFLLILFQSVIGQWFQDNVLEVTYELPSVVLAQFTVAAAFSVRTMRVTFEQMDPRPEQVALVCGCSRRQAFTRVVMPDAWRGVVAAATIAWARSLGEFGPILVFAGATRMKTEVLPTTVFLELQLGRLEAAVAVSLIMVLVAMLVLIGARLLGLRRAVA